MDPSNVRYQRESFAKAFDKHETKCKDDDIEGMHNMKRWRTALTEAANLKGCDIRDGYITLNKFIIFTTAKIKRSKLNQFIFELRILNCIQN